MESSQLPSLLQALEGLGAEAGSKEAVSRLLHDTEVRPDMVHTAKLPFT